MTTDGPTRPRGDPTAPEPVASANIAIEAPSRTHTLRKVFDHPWIKIVLTVAGLMAIPIGLWKWGEAVIEKAVASAANPELLAKALVTDRKFVSLVRDELVNNPESRRSLQGPPGERGSEGKEGPAGPPGPRGERGLQGIPGQVVRDLPDTCAQVCERAGKICLSASYLITQSSGNTYAYPLTCESPLTEGMVPSCSCR